jgi:hypothetical protein
MPSQEERLSALELAQTNFSEAAGDLNHHVTIMIGVVSREEWDIREMKGSLRAIEGRLGTLEGRMGTLEGSMRTLESRFETPEKKLDQVLLLLNSFIPKTE